MSYQQQGNSCGAWCAAHRVGVLRPGIIGKAERFVQAANFIYNSVQFNLADMGSGWDPQVQGAYAQWCIQRYSDPWRVITYLQKQGLTPALNMGPHALAAVGPLASMRFIIENLATRQRRPIRKQALSGIAGGSYAIGVCQDGPGLHYLLFHSRQSGCRVYDPRSQQLNWKRLSALPGFGGGVTTTIMSPGLQKENYRFLGVFISC